MKCLKNLVSQILGGTKNQPMGNLMANFISTRAQSPSPQKMGLRSLVSKASNGWELMRRATKHENITKKHVAHRAHSQMKAVTNTLVLKYLGGRESPGVDNSNNIQNNSNNSQVRRGVYTELGMDLSLFVTPTEISMLNDDTTNSALGLINQAPLSDQGKGSASIAPA